MENRNFHSLPVEMENGTNILAVSYKAKNSLDILLYDPAIALLGFYSIDLKNYVYTETCTQIIISALIIMTENRKQQRYPLIGE